MHFNLTLKFLDFCSQAKFIFRGVTLQIQHLHPLNMCTKPIKQCQSFKTWIIRQHRNLWTCLMILAWTSNLCNRLMQSPLPIIRVCAPLTRWSLHLKEQRRRRIGRGPCQCHHLAYHLLLLKLKVRTLRRNRLLLLLLDAPVACYMSCYQRATLDALDAIWSFHHLCHWRSLGLISTYEFKQFRVTLVAFIWIYFFFYYLKLSF